MKYFLDVQFHENFRKPLFGRPRHFIDVISIGIIAEDGRTLYLVNKDVEIKAAWNSWQPRNGQGDRNNIEPKEYWLRENVLWPIYKEWAEKAQISVTKDFFTLKNFKNSLNLFGFSAEDFPTLICEFIDARYIDKNRPEKGFIYPCNGSNYPASVSTTNIVFYSNFCHYGWVAFCSLFGRMHHLPKGMPFYCRDLRQTLEEKLYHYNSVSAGHCHWQVGGFQTGDALQKMPIVERLPFILKHQKYPEQKTERHAMHNAKDNKLLFEFIEKL